jgi:hypothetical protein
VTKAMMIQQGYVPKTCTMKDPPAGMLIWEEINSGRNPCWGCNHDRDKCHGQPKREEGR